LRCRLFCSNLAFPSLNHVAIWKK